MSSVNKGNAFEQEVFRHLEDELKNDRLFVAGRTSKIFSKKGYYSRDREKNIITDISIETYLPNATDYSLLTVVECKDYDGTIPVDDIEEFYSKVQQIAGANVKAIFATKSALQKGALTFAKSKRIGVIRYLPSDQIKWLTHFMTSNTLTKKEELNWSEFNSAFLNQGHTSYGRSFYACDDDYIYGSLYSILHKYLNGGDN
ncbi:MAG TPA: restriction endonuclease [Bacteroidia bacterium]